NLVATLLATGGVTAPSGPRIYGALTAGGIESSQPFTFTAGAASNGLISATLQLQDGAASLGTVVFYFQVGGSTTGVNPTTIVIPQLGQASPYPSVINISNAVGIVGKVTVTLSNLNHTFPDDIDVLLVGPSGERALLMSDAGGGASVSGVTLV